MNRTKEVKELALHALEIMYAKVEAIGAKPENYAVCRNLQKSIEALMETISRDSYSASDFGWKAGEWPKAFRLASGENLHMTSKSIRCDGPDDELQSVFYTGEDGKEVEIFND